MHWSYWNAQELPKNTQNSGTDPAEFISHVQFPIRTLNHQYEFQYTYTWHLVLGQYQITVLSTVGA